MSHQYITGSNNQMIRRTPGLSKPQAPPFSGDMYNWLITQIASSLHTLTPNSPRHSIAITSTLEKFPSSWCLTDMRGSLSFIVVSRRRIFIAHLGATPDSAPPHHFTNEAQGVMNNLYTFTHDGGDLENTPANNLRACILAPLRPRPETEFLLPQQPATEYVNPARIRGLQDALGSIIHTDITTMGFTPLEYRDPNLASPKGKAVVQYDPAEQWINGADGHKVQCAGVEIWLEDDAHCRYRDVWVVTAGGVQELTEEPLENMFATLPPL